MNVSTAKLMLLAGTMAAAPGAWAVTVQASANIYAAGLGSPAEIGSDGTLPVAIALDGAVGVSFHSVGPGAAVPGSPTGGATCVFDGLPSFGDGSTCANDRTDVASANGYSAFQYGGKTMPLVGLFVGTTHSPDAPQAFVSDDATANTSLVFAPLLQQVFFIGDGRTTAGVMQQFLVPQGASTLYLGFADSYGFTGGPGYYDDNYGSLSVQTNLVPVPEPAAAALMLCGLVAVGALSRNGGLLRRSGH